MTQMVSNITPVIKIIIIIRRLLGLQRVLNADAQVTPKKIFATVRSTKSGSWRREQRRLAIFFGQFPSADGHVTLVGCHHISLMASLTVSYLFLSSFAFDTYLLSGLSLSDSRERVNPVIEVINCSPWRTLRPISVCGTKSNPRLQHHRGWKVDWLITGIYSIPRRNTSWTNDESKRESFTQEQKTNVLSMESFRFNLDEISWPVLSFLMAHSQIMFFSSAITSVRRLVSFLIKCPYTPGVWIIPQSIDESIQENLMIWTTWRAVSQMVPR